MFADSLRKAGVNMYELTPDHPFWSYETLSADDVLAWLDMPLERLPFEDMPWIMARLVTFIADDPDTRLVSPGSFITLYLGAEEYDQVDELPNILERLCKCLIDQDDPVSKFSFNHWYFLYERAEAGSELEQLALAYLEEITLSKEDLLAAVRERRTRESPLKPYRNMSYLLYRYLYHPDFTVDDVDALEELFVRLDVWQMRFAYQRRLEFVSSPVDWFEAHANDFGDPAFIQEFGIPWLKETPASLEEWQAAHDLAFLPAYLIDYFDAARTIVLQKIALLQEKGD